MPGPNDQNKASPCIRLAPILRAQRVLQETRRLMLQSPRAQAPVPNSHWLVPPYPPLPLPLPPLSPSVPLPELVPANVVEPPLPSGRPVARPPRLTPRRRLEELTRSLTNRRMKEIACSAARSRQIATPPRELAAPSTLASPVISVTPPSCGHRVSTPPCEEAPRLAQSSDDQNKDNRISVDHYMPPLPPMPGPALANLMPPPPPRPRPSSAKPRVSKAQGSEKRAADSTTAEGPLKLHCTQTDRHAPRCATNCLPCMRRALRTQGTRLT